MTRSSTTSSATTEHQQKGSLIGAFNGKTAGEAPDLSTPELLIRHIDDLRSRNANNHYAVAWAHAMDTPYQWTKQVASHFGGPRNGAIVHWPNGFTSMGEIRSQFQPSLADDVWELYDTTTDWSQARDLAKDMPEKVAELKRVFDLEAAKYNVFPLDDRKAERTNPDISGRPLVVHGNTQLFFPGMRRMSENSVINIKNKSHAVTAAIEVPKPGAMGVIAAHGGNFGGWSLYAHAGKLRDHYNFLGLLQFDVTSAGALAPGAHQVRMEFAYDGGGLGKGGTATLYVDGQTVGQGRIERTHAFFFSMDETMEIGCDVGEPVSPDYEPRGNAFNGTIHWVQIDIDGAVGDVDHLIGAEERFQLAVARQ